MGIKNQGKHHKKLDKERKRLDNVRLIFLIQGWGFISLSILYPIIAMSMQLQYQKGFGLGQCAMLVYGIFWVWAGRKI